LTTTQTACKTISEAGQSSIQLVETATTNGPFCKPETKDLWGMHMKGSLKRIIKVTSFLNEKSTD
jgi:hypothetical protein